MHAKANTNTRRSSTDENAMFKNAAIIGVGQSAYTRHPKEGQTAHTFMRDAAVAALQDAGLRAADVNGMAAHLCAHVIYEALVLLCRQMKLA